MHRKAYNDEMPFGDEHDAISGSRTGQASRSCQLDSGRRRSQCSAGERRQAEAEHREIRDRVLQMAADAALAACTQRFRAAA
jgi:hypothetical protein